MSDIIRALENRLPQLSRSQKILAEYIISNCEKAAYMTAGKLSEKTGVSESTVVRFACEMGYSGYPAFQGALKENVKAQMTTAQRMELACEKIGSNDILESVLKSDIGFIEKTLDVIDREQFKKAAGAISGAKRIYVTGVRSSAALANFAFFYLRLIFDDVQLINSTGGDGLFEQLLNVGQGDVVIGISFPRYSKNTIKALHYAKDNGATVIGITDSSASPIVAESHIYITAMSDTTSFVDSLAAPLSVINALIVAVGMGNREKMQKNLEKLERIWEEYGVYDKK